MTVLLFVVILLLLVVGHEFGHFVVAKLARMKVLEFGIGFPPKIWGRKVGETEYTVNWLPFGGFVKIYGEDNENSDLRSHYESGKAMYERPKLAQACVIAAGPLMNVVIGFVLFALAFIVGVPALGDDPGVHDAHVVVGQVLAGSPAAEAGIKAGDRILSFDTPEALAESVAASEGPITISIMRGSETLSVTAIPEAGLVPGEPMRKVIGVATELVGMKQYPLFDAIGAAAAATVQNLRLIVVGLVSLIAGALSLTADLSNVAGPVGIATLTGSAAAFGLGSLLTFAAMLSLNLAIVNLLPFPALDGGRLVFLGAEAVTRRKIPAAVSRGVNAVGFALLILLMLVVTFHDIVRLVG